MSTQPNVWFTADHHFGHANVIKPAERPFKSVEEMDAEMVRRWNEVVRKGDRVYVLGDLSFHRPGRTREIVQSLEGQKYWIRGNHDSDQVVKHVEDLFVWVKDLYTLKIKDPGRPGGRQKIVLCHYSMRVWDSAHYGAWQLYGHSHGSLPDDPKKPSTDVGVDCWDFQPLRAHLDQRPFVPVDHHI